MGANMFQVCAQPRVAPVRAFDVNREGLLRLAGRFHTSSSSNSSGTEPVRAFSIPSGFSSSHTCLSLALMAIAVLACSAALLSTFLTSAEPEIRTTLIEPGELAAALPQGQGESWASLAAPERLPHDVETEQPPVPVQLKQQELARANPPESQAPTRVASAADVTSGLTDPEPVREAASDTPFAGVWATDERACTPQLKRNGLLPALISSQGAWAGNTTCAFKTSKRTGNTWMLAAVCSDPRKSWKANVRLSVVGNRLTWTSERGSQTYVRCSQGPQNVEARRGNTPPV
jgi:hypothetical protein